VPLDEELTDGRESQPRRLSFHHSLPYAYLVVNRLYTNLARSDLFPCLRPLLDFPAKHSVKDLKKAYPIISAPKERTKAFEKLWLETSEGLRAKMIVSSVVRTRISYTITAIELIVIEQT
jgi:hypothetical protein